MVTKLKGSAKYKSRKTTTPQLQTIQEEKESVANSIDRISSLDLPDDSKSKDLDIISLPSASEGEEEKLARGLIE